ncbi:MAG: hypothetical protein QW343_00040 [Candidatus Norongarragalinales archaeon]
MKLLSLELKNIRSYSSVRIDFSSGVTLFEGDIGCGKSTLLYAIEFALFGLGDLNAGFLLRHGAANGFVKLRMEILGKEYYFERTLERKRGGVQQGVASISSEGKRVEYAPREMRAAVLKILGFNEPPNPRATSWIYRYAVFTPQEEMKFVLALDDEERLNTLRKAFGIEDYRTARENAALAAREIKSVEQRLEGELADLPALEKEKTEKQNKLGEARAKLACLREKECVAEQQLAAAKQVLVELRERAKAVEGVAKEVPLLQKRLEEKRVERTLTETESEKLRKQIASDEIELAEAKKKTLPPSKSEALLKAELDSVRKKASALAVECGALSTKLLEIEELEKKGVCPTCERPICGADFAAKKTTLRSQLSEKTKAREESDAQQRSLEEALEEFREAALAAEKAAALESKLNDYRERESAAREKAEGLAKEISALETQLAQKRSELEKNFGLRESLAQAEREQNALENQVRAAAAARGAAESEVALIEARCRELAARVEEKLSKRAELEDTREKRVWLSECFVPALESIEQSVLASIQADFDAALQQFFSLLVEEEGLSVRASEAFAPLVTQDGFEQSADALSGGEKSALALAYRLALNKVVRCATPSLKENLLILDEPTDGFSKEQLERMRDVLDAVAAEQVLLVSHERELEGVADRVYRIIKEGGESKIA